MAGLAGLAAAGWYVWSAYTLPSLSTVSFDSPAALLAFGFLAGGGAFFAPCAFSLFPGYVSYYLAAVVDAYYIARRTYRKTVQNLSLAFSFNGVGVPLATTGLIAPVWAMAAMAASVTTVLLNSFWGRLVPRFRRRAPATQRLTLSVPSIHCQGCVAMIQEELVKLRGVLSVEGDPHTKQVIVTTRDGHGQRQAIEGALMRVGHVVKEK